MTQVTDDAEDEQSASGTSHEDERAHLDGVEDGCGCAEVWEHLSDERAESASD
jgi:hypothetical protein